MHVTVIFWNHLPRVYVTVIFGNHLPRVYVTVIFGKHLPRVYVTVIFGKHLPRVYVIMIFAFVPNLGGVSTTGHGEAITKATLAYRVIQLMNQGIVIKGTSIY